MRLRISDETQARETGVEAGAESLSVKKARREEALARERRVAVEKVVRAVQEEERRLQDKLLVVACAVSEERDLQQEALRQERQMNINAQEVLTREIQGVQREVTKVAKQVGRSLEDNARRFKEVGL